MQFKNTTTAILTIALIFMPQKMAWTQDTTAESENNAGKAGFILPGNYFETVPESISLIETTYTGECPGTKVESKEVVFFSENTPTAEDRRVLIRNVTAGEAESELQPFTDRKYEDEAQISEEIKISLGNRHDDKRFVMTDGENKLKYEVVQIEEENGEEFEVVLETGYFTTQIEKTTLLESRDKEERETEIDDSTITIEVCP